MPRVNVKLNCDHLWIPANKSVEVKPYEKVQLEFNCNRCNTSITYHLQLPVKKRDTAKVRYSEVL